MNSNGDAHSSEIQIRPLSPNDEAAVMSLARRLPEVDLLFLSRDLTEPKVVSAWFKAVAAGRIHSMVAARGREIVGYTALLTDPLSWSPHVGEIRVLVDPALRGHGVGRTLVQATFAKAIELGLEKLIARMTTEQQGAIAVFEELGFRGEALLKDHVRSRDGTSHDLAILSHDVAVTKASQEALGFAYALEPR